MHTDKFKVNGPGHLYLKERKQIVTTSFQSLSQATFHSLLQRVSWSVTLISFFHQIIALASDSLKFTAALVGVIKGNLISSAGPHADIVTCTVLCKIYVPWVLVGEFRIRPRSKGALCFSEHESHKSYSHWFLP